MKPSDDVIITLVVSILLSAHNALGSTATKKRILNSYADKTNIFKHEVLIKRATGTCTGSIVSNWHVLTAAHCVIQDDSNLATTELIEVTVGITQIDNVHKFQTIRLVETIYTPKDYVNLPMNASQELYTKYTGDIAVLKLNYRLGIGLDPRIEALKLPHHEYETDGSTEANPQLFFNRFGRNSTLDVYDDDVQDWVPAASPTHVHYSRAQQLPSSSCPMLGNSQLKMCAKLDNAGGMCSGDSGGPLFVANENGRVIYGVASYGTGVCNKDEGYYTKVFSYVQFINDAKNDRIADSILRQSYKYHADYQKHLKENRYRYHWIYTPEVIIRA